MRLNKKSKTLFSISAERFTDIFSNYCST